MFPMAGSTSSVLVTLVIFFLVLPSQGQAQAPPTLSFCGPLFLPLAACAPFVQGTAQAPGQTCCDNLNQLYGLQPKCLCFVLGDTPISNVFPINRTLALELPSLCGLRLSTSTCSAAASPSPTTLPRGHHTAVGLGIGRSGSFKAITSNTTFVAIAMLAAIVLAVFT